MYCNAIRWDKKINLLNFHFALCLSQSVSPVQAAALHPAQLSSPCRVLGTHHSRVRPGPGMCVQAGSAFVMHCYAGVPLSMWQLLKPRLKCSHFWGERYSLGFLTKLLSISCKFVFGRKEQNKSELTWVAAGLWS